MTSACCRSRRTSFSKHHGSGKAAEAAAADWSGSNAATTAAAAAVGCSFFGSVDRGVAPGVCSGLTQGMDFEANCFQGVMVKHIPSVKKKRWLHHCSVILCIWQSPELV